jgi:hypothetical protein
VARGGQHFYFLFQKEQIKKLRRQLKIGEGGDEKHLFNFIWPNVTFCAKYI